MQNNGLLKLSKTISIIIFEQSEEIHLTFSLCPFPFALNLPFSLKKRPVGRFLLKSRFFRKLIDIDIGDRAVRVGIADAEAVESLIDSALDLHKLLVAALFGDITARDDRDLVRTADCGESVCDDDGGSALTELVESLLNENFRRVVKRARCRDLAARKASLILGRPVTVKVVDRTARPEQNKNMEQLMAFGREHSDIIKIKNN